VLRRGDEAPEFTLPGVAPGGGRATYTLSEFHGQPVVLVFYPGDDTAVCTQQLTTYTSDIGRFDEVGAQVLAVNPQSLESHEQFACHQGGFAFPLLSDADQAVGRLYDVPGPLGFYRRSAFVIDAGGVIRYVHRARTPLIFRPTDELVAAVRQAAWAS
jgi:peroxiredoxin Q/BCP